MTRKILFIWLIFGLGSVQVINAKEDLSQYTAPEFHSGQTINLSQFSGQLIYLDFWASWCAPCRQSFPFMESLNQQYQSLGLKIIAINIDENKHNAEDFLTQQSVSFLNLYDPNGNIGKPLKVKQMPTSFLIDQHGKVLFKHSGFDKDYAQSLQQTIDKLLNNK